MVRSCLDRLTLRPCKETSLPTKSCTRFHRFPRESISRFQRRRRTFWSVTRPSCNHHGYSEIDELAQKMGSKETVCNTPYAAWYHSLKDAGCIDPERIRLRSLVTLKGYPTRESGIQAAGGASPSSPKAFRPSVSTTRAIFAGVQVEISCLKISLERKGIVDIASSIPTLEF